MVVRLFLVRIELDTVLERLSGLFELSGLVVVHGQIVEDGQVVGILLNNLL